MKLALFAGSFKPPHYGHYMLVKKLLEDPTIDKIYIIISKKSRGDITAEQSVKIWNLYYPKELANKNSRLKVMISRMDSPIQMAYVIARNLKKGDEAILVKSSKDEENQRFNMFKGLKDIKIEIWSLPQFETLSSTNMRKTITNNDVKNFMKFLPPQLSSTNKEKIWKLVKY